VRKLYIVSTSDEPNNVILGHASFARQAGWIPVFVFPFREGCAKFEEFYKDQEIVRLNFVFSARGGFAYVWSLVLLNLYTTWKFLFRPSAANFLAVDLTGVLACAFLKLRGARIHALVNDNFSARYAVSKKVYKILRYFEATSLRFFCSSSIFPDKSRYILLGSPSLDNLSFVPNILTDQYAPRYVGNASDKLSVMLCGWLVASRGIELLPQLLEKTDDQVEFLLVGSGDDDAIAKLQRHPRVKYVGHVSREENLDFMKSVDINVAFYNPTILINRHALPQKIYDSLMIGCPLFINSEVQMSTELLQHSACITAGYFDVDAIVEKLNALSKNKLSLRTMSESVLRYSAQAANFQQAQAAGVHVYTNMAR